MTAGAHAMKNPPNNLTLRGWFRLMAAALVLLVLLVEARLVWMEWQALERAMQGQQAVARLRLALVAVEMVSRERGPANGLMGAPTPSGDAALRGALDTARSRTDQALSDVQQMLTVDQDKPSYQRALRQVAAYHQALMRARWHIDRLAALPVTRRQPNEIRQRVQGMVDLIPILAPTITLLADEAQQADPSLDASVWGARLSAELREYAGQLGSLFTPALTRQQRFTGQELTDIARVRGRIDELRHLLSLRVGLLEQTDRLVKVHAAMEQDYFVQAAALVQSVLSTGQDDGRFGMTPADFAAKYVPPMNSIIALRDALLDNAELRCAQLRSEARQTLASVVLIDVLVLALVLALLRLAHERFVQPLSQAADALTAMSGGNLDLPLPQPAAEDEIAEVIGGIHALRQQSAARVALERERDELIKTLREQSTTDFLTGLPNRRAFFESAQAELARAKRHGFPVALLMLDVDFFKRVNDSVGHAGGDLVLMMVAQTLRQNVRQGDLMGRLGGEEFVALLTHCEPADGFGFAERVREAIAAQAVPVGGGLPDARVTISIGMADSGTHGLSLERLLAVADGALYKAKRAGRNRTELASSDAARA